MCRYQVDNYSYGSPHTKAFLLLQAHFSRLPLPCVDYITDLKSVLDQSIRIIQVCIVKRKLIYHFTCIIIKILFNQYIFTFRQ